MASLRGEHREAARLTEEAATITSCAGREACDHAGVANQPAAMILSDLEDPEIELRADDPEAEHRTNTWHYSLPSGFDRTAVAAALEHVVRHLSKRYRGRPGTFHCWYDEQAGQLRCSLTSKPADELPFGGRYRATSDVTDVLRPAPYDTPQWTALCEALALT